MGAQDRVVKVVFNWSESRRVKDGTVIEAELNGKSVEEQADDILYAIFRDELNVLKQSGEIPEDALRYYGPCGYTKNDITVTLRDEKGEFSSTGRYDVNARGDDRSILKHLVVFAKNLNDSWQTGEAKRHGYYLENFELARRILRAFGVPELRYLGFYGSKQASVIAPTKLDAQNLLKKILGAKRGHDVAIELVEKDGAEVVHAPTF